MPPEHGGPTVRLAVGQTVERSGEYNRLADTDWLDPLDATYSELQGGRWNAPGAFPCLYLNDTVATARIQVLDKLAGLPYGPEDLDPDEQHDLMRVEIPPARYLDCVTDSGLTLVGLPKTYPRYGNNRPVRHEACQRIGEEAWENDMPGIACRSAATGAAKTSEEMCFFARRGQPKPTMISRTSFADWWWDGS